MRKITKNDMMITTFKMRDQWNLTDAKLASPDQLSARLLSVERQLKPATEKLILIRHRQGNKILKQNI